MVRHRQVDAFRDGDGRRAGRHLENLDAMLKSDNPDVKRLLGIEGNYGEQLGSPRTGPTASSSTWETTASPSSATSGRLAAEDFARAERAVDQGRPAIRAADQVRD